MKNLAILLLCLFSISTLSFAQTADTEDKVSKEDYQRYIDSKLEMDFRNMTTKALELTKEEIIAFDPIFRRYMDDKEKLFEKRMRLLEDFREEMKEDDSVKNQDEDRADFIEDYWESEIAEMELRKDYFDRLEDAIHVDKAVKFFLWEDAIESRIKRNTYVDFIPMIVEIETLPMNKSVKTYKKDKMKMEKDKLTAKGKTNTYNSRKLSVETQKALNTFNTWNMSNKGKVDISHEYTAAGLNATVAALEGINTDMGFDIPSFTEKKKMIQDVANNIQKDASSLEHADMVRKAFVTIGELMQSVSNNNKLTTIGQKIDPDVMLTKQAPHIYKFFETANMQLQDLTKNTKMDRSK